MRDAINLLNYEPNNIARSLSNKTSNLIALIIPNLNNPYFSDLVNIIETNSLTNMVTNYIYVTVMIMKII